MASLAELVRLHGRYDATQISHLQRLVASWGPIADLCFADMLLFDARPPKQPGRLPGGNGLAFDWRLLQDLRLDRPWLLSGGLSADNLAAAVTLCRPPAVDVSSGVERRPGHKDPAKIRAFLDLARGLAVAAPAPRTTAPSSCP